MSFLSSIVTVWFVSVLKKLGNGEELLACETDIYIYGMREYLKKSIVATGVERDCRRADDGKRAGFDQRFQHRSISMLMRSSVRPLDDYGLLDLS